MVRARAIRGIRAVISIHNIVMSMSIVVVIGKRQEFSFRKLEKVQVALRWRILAQVLCHRHGQEY